MTIFYSQKRKVFPVFAIALLFVMFNLLQPVKMYAQNKTAETLQIYAAPGVTATFTTEVEPNENTGEISGRMFENEPQPDLNAVLAAPPNDNCSTALLAANTLTPGGNYKCGTVNQGTTEAGENLSCFSPAATETVWYSFTADQSTMWINIKPNGSFICSSSFGMAVYNAGGCPVSGPIACLNYFTATGSNYNSKLSLTGLTVGNVYMIQLALNPGCLNTTKPYCIKIGHPTTCTTCANVCGPMCVYAGPTPPTTLQITSTCPSYPLSPPMNQNDFNTSCYSFTAANDSVYLQQIVYSSCNPNTYSFTYNLYTAGCASIQSGNVFANNLITGLTVGVTYKICYTFQSACSFDSVVWPYAYTTSTVLPVELVSWGAMPFSEKVKLYWTTASEENSKEYIIEKTYNAKDFTEVAHVKAAGKSTSLLNYKGFDNSPREGNNFYRLKQIDFNGQFTYTKLVAVKFSRLAGAGMTIIPNPTSDKTIVKFNASGKFVAVLKVSDMQGITCFIKNIISEEGVNEYTLNMNELAKGVYSVQLILDDLNEVSKLVKE
ncbi:MAG: T9SS type A sorting domain-containing protein [Bacteroidia bacterium]